MPRFSIVTPVYNTRLRALRDCIASVRDQTFDDWEMCLVDDGSTDPKVRVVLDEAAAAEPRIRVTHRAENGGIVAASNDALAMARGQFVVLLDHDDLLTRDALTCVDEALRTDKYLDYVYSDEDKITLGGARYDEFRKPDWSPERFRAHNYLCHLSVIRSSLVRQIGGFRSGFDGSQDYDLLLRVTEVARRIHHIPKVLYHWRAEAGSAAADAFAKPAALTVARRALAEHCTRIGLDAEVHRTEFPGYFRVVRHVEKPPLVSLIIPTRGSTRTVWGIETCLVLNAVMSVCERSSYQPFELVIVADEDTDDEVLRALERAADCPLVVVPYDREFNFAAKINLGAAHASGDVLVLLNDDTEVISHDWLETLVGLVSAPDVGMVGPLLRFADGTVQTAGHTHDGGMRNLGQYLPGDVVGPFALFRVARECMGVTAACAAVRREVFEEVGGMNVALSNSFNDVDLSLKLRHFGYRNIWTPFAELYHFESMTRDPTVLQMHAEPMVRRWGVDLLVHDPYGPDPYRTPEASAHEVAGLRALAASVR